MLLKLSSSSLLSAPNSYLARAVGIIDHKSTIGNAPLLAAGRAPLGLSKPRSSLPMKADARVPRVCIAFASKICSARAAATVCRWDGLISAFWSSPETRIFASFALILRAWRRANESFPEYGTLACTLFRKRSEGKGRSNQTRRTALPSRWRMEIPRKGGRNRNRNRTAAEKGAESSWLICRLC